MFNPLSFVNLRLKAPIHVVQIVLALTVLILAGVRLATFPKTAPRTRGNTIALGMSAKSIIIIGYQLLTDHIARLRRYRSPKANLILNSLEIVFWSAVTFLVMQANTKSCIGVSCILGWVVMGLGIVQSSIASYAAMISFVEFRQSRQELKSGSTTESQAEMSNV